MDVQDHWEKVYGTKQPTEVSWYRPHLDLSLALIDRTGVGPSASIIDVGGGASTLGEDLLSRGYQDITVLDISKSAIELARSRLGSASQRIHWIAADITTANLPAHSYDIWHDRAVFHFLTDRAQRVAYVQKVISTVKPGGHVIVATFGPEGPQKCSGVNVDRYDANSLRGEFGSRFRLVESTQELHPTPFGTTQQFLYCYCRID